MLEPYILPCVDEMIDEVESGKAWTLAHVPETISNLMRGMNDVASLVPESFYEVTHHHSKSFSGLSYGCYHFVLSRLER